MMLVGTRELELTALGTSSAMDQHVGKLVAKQVIEETTVFDREISQPIRTVILRYGVNGKMLGLSTAKVTQSDTVLAMAGQSRSASIQTNPLTAQ